MNVECIGCDGTGRVRNTDEEIRAREVVCSECDGHGEIEMDRDDVRDALVDVRALESIVRKRDIVIAKLQRENEALKRGQVHPVFAGAIGAVMPPRAS